MGIGAQEAAEILARFDKDVVALKPRYAVIMAGVNDLANGTTKSEYIASMTSMLYKCNSNGIIPVVIKILPWTNGTNTQMQNRDNWMVDLKALVVNRRGLFVDCDESVGVYRAGGDPGNYWNQQPALNDDNVHWNEAGDEKIARCVFTELLNVDTAEGYGPELNTLANAVSIPNETDATTGWSQQHLDVGANVFESILLDGELVFHANADDTPTSAARFLIDLETMFGIQNGDECRLILSKRGKGTGAGTGQWDSVLDDAVNGSGGIVVASVDKSDTTFQAFKHEWVHDANHRYLVIRESNSENDGGVYFDAFSLRKKL